MWTHWNCVNHRLRGAAKCTNRHLILLSRSILPGFDLLCTNLYMVVTRYILNKNPLCGISVMLDSRRKGKILRVKLGYNPNSSSIGSIVFAIPSMLFVGSVVFGTVTTILFSKHFQKSASRRDGDGKRVTGLAE